MEKNLLASVAFVALHLNSAVTAVDAIIQMSVKAALLHAEL
jgi:hypothetical protein